MSRITLKLTSLTTSTMLFPASFSAPAARNASTSKHRPMSKSDMSSLLTLGAALAALLSFIVYIYSTFGSFLLALIEKNQFLQAILVPSLLGAVVYAAQVAFTSLYGNFIGANLYCSVSIESSEQDIFDAVVDFAEQQSEKQSTCMTVQKKKKKWNYQDWKKEFMQGIASMPDLAFRAAATGRGASVSRISWQGRSLMYMRTRGQTITVGYSRKPVTQETITVWALGTDTSILTSFVEGAVMANTKELTKDLKIYVMSDEWFGGWEAAMGKKPRSVDSVILDTDMNSIIVEDARKFLSSQEWYANAGIPYRRGYLLHGPPGNGKTSFCQALAGELQLHICMLSLSNKGLDDNKLASAIREAPTRSVILLEDVDAVFVGRELQQGHKDASGVTFSGLLNAIDGVASQEGRMFFMTTNHIEKLDPALIRPGRCDVKLLISNASRNQMVNIFLRFFPGQNKLAQDFASQIPAGELSMASLQGHLLEFKESADDAVLHISKLLQQNKPKLAEDLPIFDHLRRLGLERFTSLFEYHGYTTRSDVQGLDCARLADWSIELKTSPILLGRLKKLIEGNNQEIKDLYATADRASIKQIFLARYLSRESYQSYKDEEPEPLRREHSLKGFVVKSPPTSRLPSSGKGLSAAGSPLFDEDGWEGLDHMANLLCDMLSSGGKSLVSLWQINWLVNTLYPDSANDALDNCKVLIRTREAALGKLREPSKGLSEDHPSSLLGGTQVRLMTMYEWLLRLGLEKYADSFEDEGAFFADDIKDWSKTELEACGCRNKREQRLVLAVIGMKDEEATLTRGFELPDRSCIRAECLAAFPGQVQVAKKLSELLTDEAGYGRVSNLQLARFLQQLKVDMPTGSAENLAMEAVKTAKEKLIDSERPPRQPRPPKPEPTDFVHTWLKSFGMEQHSRGLIQNDICTKEDVISNPPLGDKDLEDSGVSTLGARRRILSELKKLRAVEGVGDPQS